VSKKKKKKKWHTYYFPNSTQASTVEKIQSLIPEDGEGTLGEEVAKALKAAQSAEPCHWTYDAIDNAWDAACGEKWVFTTGGPTENHVRFCHGCGRPVSAAMVKEPKEKTEP